MNTRTSLAPLRPEQIEVLRRLAQGDERGFCQRAGLSHGALLRALSGLPITRGTRSIVAAALLAAPAVEQRRAAP
jgi:hypothetical protein